MENKELQEHLVYLKSDEYKEQVKTNLLSQMVSYINNKYGKNSILLKEECNFEITGSKDKQEQILQELNDFGLIK